MEKFLGKVWRFSYRIVIVAVILGTLLAFVFNGYVRVSTKENIISIERASNLMDVDCIIVLGCLVKPGGDPSSMLYDRLLTGIQAYEQGVAPKIIMSGDHATIDYDEVNAMKNFAIENGVPSRDIFMDHAGFSTYESMYRAKEIFGAKRVVIVSQEYHLYRAISIAKQLGMDAYGISADLREYQNQYQRNFREFLATAKDFVKCLIKPEPTYLGDKINLKGSGDVTNDH